MSYGVTKDVRLILGWQWYLQIADEEETRPLSQLCSELQDGFDSASTVSLYAGIELKL